MNPANPFPSLEVQDDSGFVVRGYKWAIESSHHPDHDQLQPQYLAGSTSLYVSGRTVEAYLKNQLHSKEKTKRLVLWKPPSTENPYHLTTGFAAV